MIGKKAGNRADRSAGSLGGRVSLAFSLDSRKAKPPRRAGKAGRQDRRRRGTWAREQNENLLRYRRAS